MSIDNNDVITFMDKSLIDKDKKFDEMITERAELDVKAKSDVYCIYDIIRISVEELIKKLEESNQKLVDQLTQKNEEIVSTLPKDLEENIKILEDEFEDFTINLEAESNVLKQKFIDGLPVMLERIDEITSSYLEINSKLESDQKQYNDVVAKNTSRKEISEKKHSDLVNNYKDAQIKINQCRVQELKRKLALEYLRKRCEYITPIHQKIEKEISEMSIKNDTKQRQVDKLFQNYTDEKTHRRVLYDELLTLNGNIRVYTIPGNTTEALCKYRDERLLTIGDKENETDYEFDYCFKPNLELNEIYEHLEPFIRNVFLGYTNTILSYGNSDSGKNAMIEGSKTDPGILELCIQTCLKQIRDYPNTKYIFSLSILEIYKDHIVDLLTLPKDIRYEDITDWDNQEFNVNPILFNRLFEKIKTIEDYSEVMKRFRLRKANV